MAPLALVPNLATKNGHLLCIESITCITCQRSVCLCQTLGPIDRTPDIPGSDKNIHLQKHSCYLTKAECRERKEGARSMTWQQWLLSTVGRAGNLYPRPPFIFNCDLFNDDHLSCWEPLSLSVCPTFQIAIYQLNKMKGLCWWPHFMSCGNLVCPWQSFPSLFLRFSPIPALFPALWWSLSSSRVFSSLIIQPRFLAPSHLCKPLSLSALLSAQTMTVGLFFNLIKSTSVCWIFPVVTV